MRIAYVTYEFITFDTNTVVDGGLANYLYKISKAMIARGHEIHIFIAQNQTHDRIFEGMHVHFFNPFAMYFPSHGFRTATNKLEFIRRYWRVYLKKFLDRFPLIKHVKIHSLSQELRMHSQNIQKTIMQYHKVTPFDIIQYPNDNFFALCPPDIPYCVRISTNKKEWFEIYNIKTPYAMTDMQSINTIMKNAPYIFGPSKRIADVFKTDLELTKEIKIIETLTKDQQIQEDPSKYHELENMMTKGSSYLIFWGSIGTLKGISDIAAIIQQLFAKYQDLYFVLVGKELDFAKDKPIKTLLKQAEQYSNRIIHFDKMPHSQLYPLIKNAKGAVLPSRIDNFPNTCVEAMSLKKAIVGTYEGSFEQLLTDNESGFICHGNNPPSLFDAICRLMDTPDQKLQEIGNRAYERTKDLAPEKIAQQTEEYYQFVIDNFKNDY